MIVVSFFFLLNFIFAVNIFNEKFSTLAMVNKKRHSRKSPRSGFNSSSAERNLGNSHFKEDQDIFLGINNTVNELKDEINTLRHELNKVKREVTQVKTENAWLKQAINLNIYSQDRRVASCPPPPPPIYFLTPSVSFWEEKVAGFGRKNRLNL